MTKRTLAALLALLVAASTLAVVASSPAGAHSKTVKRCAYDPFAGNQCWNENVSHTHACGAGMIGTYPNCYPAPSTNKNTPDTDAEEEAKRKAAEAEAERKRKEAEEAERKRKAAEAEAERKRKAAEAEAERKRKEAEEAERKRKEAEAEAERKRKAEEEGTGTGTTTTSTDPCATWVSTTQNALNTANADGTYNIPAVPDGCKTSTREMLGKLRVSTTSALDAVWGEIKKSLDKNYEAIEANNAVYEEMAKAIQDAWNATPEPIRNVVKVGVCTGLFASVMVAIVKSKGKIAKAGPFATQVYVVADAAGCGAVVAVLNAVTVDDSDPDSDADGSGSESDSDGTDQGSDDGDSGTDDSDQGDGHPGDSDDGSDDDSDSDSDSDGGTGDGHPGGTDQESGDDDKVTPDDVVDAINRGEDVGDLLKRMYCQQGDPRYAGHC